MSEKVADSRRGWAWGSAHLNLWTRAKFGSHVKFKVLFRGRRYGLVLLKRDQELVQGIPWGPNHPAYDEMGQ